MTSRKCEWFLAIKAQSGQDMEDLAHVQICQILVGGLGIGHGKFFGMTLAR